MVKSLDNQKQIKRPRNVSNQLKTQPFSLERFATVFLIMAETQNQRLPQDVAKHLFSEGAILIVAGVPTGTDFGIDLDVNKVDELFRGVKMIPPGPHYVYTAAEGLYGDVATRVGFMHYYKRQEIVIREWDDQTEELKERPSTSVALDEARVRRNILDIDR